MITIITAAPYVLTLLLCAGLSYGQDNSPQPPKAGDGSKAVPARG